MNKVSINFFLGLSIIMAFSCQEAPKTIIEPWQSYDESEMLAAVADHEITRMQLKLVQSKVQDKNDIWDPIREDIAHFGEEDYKRLEPFIYEQDIEEIQSAVKAGQLTYEELTKWYIYRIVQLENDSARTLHTIVAFNSDAVEQAKEKDRNRNADQHPIYGMPVLLKDNINTEGMPTTAGALALQNNETGDATIVSNLKKKGAIILGKVNLSEWAYFFCGGCPVGYSAIGGQTLNPYGRGVFETGGSSAGSGTSMAANYAAAAVGTETSGSILSPSGKNSLVGLKPSIGLLSRSGIVPISSTLDTPGPMTRSVSDNVIMLSAMASADEDDEATAGFDRDINYFADYKNGTLSGKRFGVIKRFLQDSIYKLTTEKIEKAGATLVVYDPPEVSLDGFGTLLAADMKRDLPHYLSSHVNDGVSVKSVQDVIDYNAEDTLIRAPYGQVRLEGSAQDTLTDEALAALVVRLHKEGRRYFDEPMAEHELDAVLSMNNWSAGFAAAAKYPCLTVPMGYSEAGEPTNLTFIGKSQSEAYLYQLGYAFEQLTKVRKPPF